MFLFTSQSTYSDWAADVHRYWWKRLDAGGQVVGAFGSFLASTPVPSKEINTLFFHSCIVLGCFVFLGSSALQFNNNTRSPSHLLNNGSWEQSEELDDFPTDYIIRKEVGPESRGNQYFNIPICPSPFIDVFEKSYWQFCTMSTCTHLSTSISTFPNYKEDLVDLNVTSFPALSSHFPEPDIPRKQLLRKL